MRKVEDGRAEDVVGPGEKGTVNKRGSRIIESCQINDFTITNTLYQNHPRQQWTWKSPGDRSKNKEDNYSHSETIPDRHQNTQMTTGNRE
ncbi:hypothetical protein PoB_004854800 [Plakobranchus ocellatus]|uniref:Uncharacterized protein n=1 Tax=Plakobranchus ocellatus TaxID=259542 RepID=A0AAV4BR36_9GAST|nr:hypothetical protein PoB_004854800 [Plakobranchus ocellatus]